MTRGVVPGRGFTSPEAARVVEVTDVRAYLAFGWVCSVTNWQAPNKKPVCVCVCVCVCTNDYPHMQVMRALHKAVRRVRGQRAMCAPCRPWHITCHTHVLMLLLCVQFLRACVCAHVCVGLL